MEHSSVHDLMASVAELKFCVAYYDEVARLDMIVHH
jgi:hypothetical protein